MTLPNGLVSVVDLFSGAGGLSYGFMAHVAFEMIGAADARRRGGSVAYYGHPMARVCRTGLVRWTSVRSGEGEVSDPGLDVAGLRLRF